METDKQFYKRLMLETSNLIIERMLELLKPLKKEDKEMYNICIELIKKRKNKMLARGFLSRFSYEIVSSKNWEEIIDFCSAVEIELASLYYSNRIFDEKGGKKILNEPNNQFIASMITRDIATLTISNLSKFLSQEKFLIVKNTFDEINKDIYIGQFFDMNKNIYFYNQRIDERTLIDNYIKRCYEMNVVFFEKIGRIGAIMGDGNEKEIEALSTFGKNYGIALQITNDIADFVPPKEKQGSSEKIPDDAYSDILHGKLTAPIIYTLINGSKNDKKLIINGLKNKKKLKMRDLIKITQMLVRNGSINQSIRLARQYSKKAKKSLEIFPIEKRKPLSLMCVMIDSNRYYKALNKYKQSP